MIKIFLDDIRIPLDDQWIIIKSYYDFIDYIPKIDFQEISEISLDHDLGDDKSEKERTGFDVAKWLVDYCIDNDYIMPQIKVHSSNTVGSDNIILLINNFLSFSSCAPTAYKHVVELKRGIKIF